MGHFYDEIPDDPKLIEWVKEQQLFHVATAPLKGTSHFHPCQYHRAPLTRAHHHLLCSLSSTNLAALPHRRTRQCVSERPDVVQNRQSARMLVSRPHRLRCATYHSTPLLKVVLMQRAPLAGNETISHLYEPGNGRLVIMFEAFQGPPRILRFWGRGTPYTEKIYALRR